MTRLRLRYVQAFVSPSGRVYYYFRRSGFPLVRLPGFPGSTEFMAAYRAALDGGPRAVGIDRTQPGTVNAAIVAFYGSPEWRSTSAGTQQQRISVLERFRDVAGDLQVRGMTAAHIAGTLTDLKPFAARNWLKTLRALMAFAVSHGIRPDNPAIGLRLPRAKTTGIHTWTESEIEAFEAVHAVGTKARLALALLLYTAQRRGDVIRMGRQHIRDGAIAVRQQKTSTELRIPVHPRLRAVLDATPSDHLTFLVTRSGQPFQPSDFSEQFRTWCNDAGLPPKCSAHGLRKAACRRLAEAGCSTPEIASISGHKSLREIERYIAAADQERMARNAMAREHHGNPTVKKT